MQHLWKYLRQNTRFELNFVLSGCLGAPPPTPSPLTGFAEGTLGSPQTPRHTALLHGHSSCHLPVN